MISPLTMSFPTQRLLVTAAFFMLQGVKLASAKSGANLFVFSALDAGFAYYLPVLAIPRLNFKPNVVFVQVLLLLLLNYTVFVNSDWLLYLIIQPVLALLRLSGSKSALDASDRDLITGKYVVDLLPEATAKLDTISPLCIDTAINKPVALRLAVNGTWPSAVRLSRAELGNTENFSQVKFGSREIAKFPQDNKQEIFIPVTEPGAYYLDGITDEETGLRVKIQRERVVVPPCPTANVELISDSQLCEGSKFQAEIAVSGMSPLEALIDGKWMKLGDELADDGLGEFRIPIEKPALNGGSVLSAGISEVRDKIGTTIKRLPDAVSARVVNPARVFVPQQRLPNVDGSVNAQLQVHGEDGPFEVIFAGPDNEFSVVLNSAGSHLLQVNELGTYRVLSVNGARCPGSVEGSFEVFSPPPVGLSVDYQVIEDRCAGPKGIDAKIKLEGTGPWNVGFRTIKGSRVVKEASLDFNEADSKSNSIQFIPRNIGDFTYELLYVKDRYRQLNLQGDEYRVSQSIKELPGAKFAAYSNTKLCGESKAWADVAIRGRGPFTLKYSVDDKVQYEKTTEGTKDSDTARLDFDFENGNHYVRLLSMTDRNGCVTDLGGIRSPDFVVRNHIPSIKLGQPGDYKSAEPVRMTLPLQAENLKYPATLVYEHISQNGKKSQYSVTLNSPHDQIPASDAGTYKLVSLDDGVCGGTANDVDEVNITLYDRPKIELISPDDIGLCHKQGSIVSEFNLTGEAPFAVTHEVVDPTGKSHVSKSKVTKNHYSIDLDASIVGEYTHYLWVSDSQYHEIQQSNYLKFSHQVWAPALSRFNTKQPNLETCENTMLEQKIPVLLKGEAPFQLTVQVGDDIKVLNVPNTSQLDLRKEIGLLTQSGKLKVEILEVSDKHGCKAPVQRSTNTFDVNVLPQPEVPELSKSDFCVGEVVSFPIKGRGSTFGVQYKYNEKRHNTKITLDSRRKFDVPAKVPGNLTLSKVSDENGCELDTGVTAHVHKLPGSTITEQPHFSIYEGDKISLGFAFDGTAPFSFIYIHTVGGKVKERKEIRDIMEDNYTLIVDEEGEYEIIEVRDKFCKSERKKL